MQDVASAAGVSQATVSFVLNGVAGARISDQTRDRVFAAAKALGYKRSTRIRADAGAGSAIALIIDEVDASPFAPPFLAGAREAAWEHQCIVATVSTRGHEPMEKCTIEAILGLPLVGVLYATLLTREVRAPTLASDIPVVLLNCYEELPRYSAALPDDFGGSRAITGILAAAGHTRIGHLAGEDWLDAGRDRLAGYYAGLSDHGLGFDPDLVQHFGSAYRAGLEGTHALLDLADPPTALTCFNDRIAVGALEAARDRGRRVPYDLSIAGFDNDAFATNLFLGGLTTVELPHESMARWAVHRIFEIRNKHLQPRIHRLNCPIIRRGSVMRPMRLRQLSAADGGPG
jgi:LacI family transcriptional regulator